MTKTMAFSSAIQFLFLQTIFLKSCTNLSCAEIIELDGEFGEFTSPNYPENYTNDVTTEWRIRVPSTQARVHLYFPDFSTEWFYDTVEVRDGDSADSPLLLRQSGLGASALISSGPSMFIIFRVDEINSDRGFKAVYAQVLDNVYREELFGKEVGTVFTPYLYPPGIDYTWLIKSNIENAPIQLKFAIFNVSILDQVEIRDGGDLTSPLLGEHSGPGLPPVYYSTGGNMLIRLKSSAQSAPINNGIMASFLSVIPKMVDVYESIYMHEDNYNASRGSDRTWILASPQQDINFTMQFFDTSYFEEGIDFFEIRDGATAASSLLYNLTGFDRPDLISVNSLFMRLLSDPALGTGRFQIRAVLDKFVMPVQIQATSFERIWSAYNDVYLNYTNNADHTWEVTSQPRDRMMITFLDPFDSEDGVDILTLRDGNSTTSPILTTISGRFEREMEFVTTTNKAHLNFKTDGQVTREGFYANIRNIKDGKYNGQRREGVLTSPNYPHDSPHSIEFGWSFHKRGGLWELTFEEFDTVESDDYIEVIDGYRVGDPVIGKFWGKEIPPKIKSTADDLFIRQVTNEANPSKGFRALVESKYWSDYLDPEGDTVISENWPERYPPQSEQVWVLSCPTTSQVHLVFHNFSINTMSTNDRLDIRDGNSSSATLLGSHRGGWDLPPPYYSSRNQLYLYRNGWYQDYGFRATFVCSDRKTELKNFGEFHSPHYPENYTNNLIQTWVITVPTLNSVAALKFHEFDTEADFDIVEVRDGDSETSPLLAKLSGPVGDYPPIFATTNKMWVRFTSSANGTSRGFFASYYDPAGITPTTRPTTTTTTTTPAPTMPTDEPTTTASPDTTKPVTPIEITEEPMPTTAPPTVRPGPTSSSPVENTTSNSAQKLPAFVSLLIASMAVSWLWA